MVSPEQTKGLAMWRREGDLEAKREYERTDQVIYGGLVASLEQLGGLLHTAIFGDIRSGKSIVLSLLMRFLSIGPIQFRGRSITRNRAVVFDPAAELIGFARACAAPEEFLFPLFPFDAVASGVDFNREIRTDYDRHVFALRITNGEVQNAGSERFWANLSAVLVSAVVAALQEADGDWTLADVIRPFTTEEFGTIEHFLKHSSEGQIALDVLKSQGMERTQGSARLSLISELRQFNEIAAATEHHIQSGRRFSFREDLMAGSPLVFLGNPSKSKPLDTFLELQQNLLLQTLLEDSNDRNTAANDFTDPTFVFIDELSGASFRNLPTLLREGGKRGAVVYGVLHELSALDVSFPGKQTDHLVSQLAKGLIVTRIKDPATRLKLSELLGGHVNISRDSFSYAPSGEVTRNRSIVAEWLVHPATFADWPLANFDTGFRCLLETPAGHASQTWVTPQMLHDFVPRRTPGRVYELLDDKHLKLRPFDANDWDRLRLPAPQHLPAPQPSSISGFIDPEAPN